MNAAIESYLLDGKARNLRPATITAYGLQLDYFSHWAAARGVTTLETITPTLIKTYFTDQLQRGLSPHTAKMSGRCLRAWLNWCVAEGLLPESPMQRVKLPRTDAPNPDFFTVAEVRRMLDGASTRDRALLLFLLDSGARLGETAALTVADVDLASGRVRLRTQTKSRRPRTVYLGNVAAGAMAAWLRERPAAPHDALWTAAVGDAAITRIGVQEIVKRAGRRVGVKPCAPHRFRRTFAAWSLRSGADVAAVAEMLGHSDVGMLKHYAALIDDDLKRAHDVHSPADNFLK